MRRTDKNIIESLEILASVYAVAKRKAIDDSKREISDLAHLLAEVTSALNLTPTPATMREDRRTTKDRAMLELRIEAALRTDPEQWRRENSGKVEVMA